MDPISGILTKPPVTKMGVKKTSEPISDRFTKFLEDVNTRQNEADKASEKVVKGQLGIHEGMLALHEADTSLRYLVKVREKVLQAYNEIRKMPI